MIKEHAIVNEKNLKLEQEIQEYSACEEEKSKRLEEASVLL